MFNLRSKLTKTVHFTLVALILFLFSGRALADQFDDQINALRAEVSQQQAQANALQGQADTLANKVAGLNAQIASTNAQLALNQAQYDKLTADLASAEKKMAEKRAILDEGIKTIYLEGQVTPVE